MFPAFFGQENCKGMRCGGVSDLRRLYPSSSSSSSSSSFSSHPREDEDGDEYEYEDEDGGL